MRYLQGSFSVSMGGGGEEYRANWDRIFGKHQEIDPSKMQAGVCSHCEPNTAVLRDPETNTLWEAVEREGSVHLSVHKCNQAGLGGLRAGVAGSK